MLSLEKKMPPLHRAIHNIMRSSPKIQQPIKLIECSKGSLNLMNTNVLKDNIEKNTKHLYMTCSVYCVFHSYTNRGIYR